MVVGKDLLIALISLAQYFLAGSIDPSGAKSTLLSCGFHSFVNRLVSVSSSAIGSETWMPDAVVVVVGVHL